MLKRISLSYSDFGNRLLEWVLVSRTRTFTPSSWARSLNHTDPFSNELITIITEEYEHRLLTERRPTKRGGTALAVLTVTGRVTTRRTVGVQGEGKKGRGRTSKREGVKKARSRVLTQQPSHPRAQTILPSRREALSWTREPHRIFAPIDPNSITSSPSLPRRSTRLTDQLLTR